MKESPWPDNFNHLPMFAVIRIPDFSLQSLLRHEPELWLRPVAVLEESDKKAAVFQMTLAAREAGVREGLTSTQALARCAEVLIKARSRLQEENTSAILLQTAYDFSPRIEATADGVCTMDLRGLSVMRDANIGHISIWAEKIISTLAAAKLRASVGIASTPALALHAARCARTFLLVEQPAQFVADLPVESLEPLPDILDLLQRWGIRNVGEFIALGKNNLAERLGPDAIEMFERVSTDAIRPLELIAPPDTFSEMMEFEVEIESLPPLFFVLNRFVEQLTLRTAQRHFVVAELRLRLQMSSGDHYESRLKVPSPTGKKDVLFRMLQTHLENVKTESPVVALELSATPCRIGIHQFGLFEAALRDPNQFSETLARLTALCGAENVGTPVLQDTHRPDAFQIVSPDFEKHSSESPAHKTDLNGLKLRRFRPPVQASVRTQHGVPIGIHASHLNERIENCSGPWRSSGDWWEQERLWNRDEWDIQTGPGALYRIYHENDAWFVEGIYD
jgi:protein ImuB